MFKICEKCGKLVDLSLFLKREDRAGYYAWDVNCMAEQGREAGYPTSKKRGGGSLELEPRD